MANPFINPNDPNLQTQNPDLSQVLLPPAPAPSFAAHMANPANIAAIAPSVAPRSVVTPSNATPKPNSIFNAASNWFAPSGVSSMPSLPPATPPAVSGPSGGPSFITPSSRGVAQGMISPGNIDISNRPNIFNPQTGGRSSVWSSSLGTDKGEVLVPRITDGEDGLPPHILSDKRVDGQPSELDQYYRKYGKSLGTFNSGAAADSYGQQLHLDQAKMQPIGNRIAASVAGPNDVMGTKRPMVSAASAPAASAPAPAVNAAGMGAAPLPSVIPAVSPMVQSGLQSKTNADQQKLNTLQANGAGLNQIHNGFLRGLARAGDIAGSILAPGVAAQLPGTTLHNLQLQNRQQGIVAQDQKSQQIANQQYQQGLQNQDTQSQIGLRNAQAANLPELAQLKQAALDQKYAAIGQKPLLDSEGNATGQYVPDEQSPIYQKQKAQNDYFTARAEYEGAAKDYAKARTDATNANPDTPAGRQSIIKLHQAEQRLGIAQQVANTSAGRLGLSGQEFAFNQDKFYNPQPTAAERGKGDLAQSAVERVAEMKAIVKKHPEYFGPGEGRATRAQEWLGSQDPDAQTYLSAGQYLSDHSAGVFGGRGKYITEQLHNLTDPKMNPAALNAALDEAERAAQGFVKAGAVHGKGGGTPPPGGAMKQLDSKTAQTFLKQAGGDKAKARQLAKQAGYAF